MLPGMQVGLFFLRARRIRNLLRTMTREAGRVPAPRTPLSKIFRRAARESFLFARIVTRHSYFQCRSAPALGKALTLQYLLAIFPQQKNFCTHTTHGGTANRHHGVRCEED